MCSWRYVPCSPKDRERILAEHPNLEGLIADGKILLPSPQPRVDDCMASGHIMNRKTYRPEG